MLLLALRANFLMPAPSLDEGEDFASVRENTRKDNWKLKKEESTNSLG